MSDDDKTAVFGCTAVFMLIAAVVGIFIYLKTSTYHVESTVVDTTWKRDINVERFTALAQDTYEWQMPGDAYNVQKYTTSHMESYSCDEHEECTGSGKHESCEMVSDTCWRSVTDYRARYTISRWTYNQTLETKGKPSDERVWPDFTPRPEPTLGNDRERDRTETFYVAFHTADKQDFVYTTTDLNVWRAYTAGESVSFEVNRLNEPQWNTLKVEARE